MTLGYGWSNIASWTVNVGRATITFYIDAKLNRQDKNGNYSVIDTRLTSNIVNNLSGTGYNFQLTGSGGISGNGVWYFKSETILTGQYTVYHDSNGYGYSTAGAHIQNNYWGINYDFSGGFNLPSIPRYASFTKYEISNITMDSVSITWGASTNCDAIQYSLNGGNWINISGYPTCTIKDLSPHTTYKIKVRIKSSTSQLWTESSLKEFKTKSVPLHLFIKNSWKEVIPYIRKDGQWKIITPYIRKNNQWKRGK